MKSQRKGFSQNPISARQWDDLKRILRANEYHLQTYYEIPSRDYVVNYTGLPQERIDAIYNDIGWTNGRPPSPPRKLLRDSIKKVEQKERSKLLWLLKVWFITFLGMMVFALLLHIVPRNWGDFFMFFSISVIITWIIASLWVPSD